MSDCQEILDPGRVIIDPHHHLWHRSNTALAALPFPAHGFSRMLDETSCYLLEALQVDVNAGRDVRATVFVECHSGYRSDGPAAFRCVGETAFACSVAADAVGTGCDVAAGIVGHADLRLGSGVGEVLDAHLEAGEGRFRGLRHSAAFDADASVLGPLSARGTPAGLLQDTIFRAGFAELAPRGLSFDAWVLAPQLAEVVELAQAFPDTRIVLDHVGTPLGIGAYAGRRAAGFDAWRAQILALARCDNVTVKLGGLAMPFGGFGWSYDRRATSHVELADAWAPYLATCIEAFGPGRCMFESNFPVDHFSCDYTTLWNAFKHFARVFSDDEKQAMFFDTANRVYRLGLHL